MADSDDQGENTVLCDLATVDTLAMPEVCLLPTTNYEYVEPNENVFSDKYNPITVVEDYPDAVNIDTLLCDYVDEVEENKNSLNNHFYNQDQVEHNVLQIKLERDCLSLDIPEEPSPSDTGRVTNKLDNEANISFRKDKSKRNPNKRKYDLSKIPLVYTKRLDDMPIFKNCSKFSIKHFNTLILLESFPKYDKRAYSKPKTPKNFSSYVEFVENLRKYYYRNLNNGRADSTLSQEQVGVKTLHDRGVIKNRNMAIDDKKLLYVQGKEKTLARFALYKAKELENTAAKPLEGTKKQNKIPKSKKVTDKLDSGLPKSKKKPKICTKFIKLSKKVADSQDLKTAEILTNTDRETTILPCNTNVTAVEEFGNNINNATTTSPNNYAISVTEDIEMVKVENIEDDPIILSNNYNIEKTTKFEAEEVRNNAEDKTIPFKNNHDMDPLADFDVILKEENQNGTENKTKYVNKYGDDKILANLAAGKAQNELLKMCKPLSIILRDIKYSLPRPIKENLDSVKTFTKVPARKNTKNVKKASSKPKRQRKPIDLTNSTRPQTLISKALQYSRPSKTNIIADTYNQNASSFHCSVYCVDGKSGVLECYKMDKLGNVNEVNKITKDNNSPQYINLKHSLPTDVERLISVCCWAKREKMINALGIEKGKLNNFINVPHSCTKTCLCCCRRKLNTDHGEIVYPDKIGNTLNEYNTKQKQPKQFLLPTLSYLTIRSLQTQTIKNKPSAQTKKVAYKTPAITRKTTTVTRKTPAINNITPAVTRVAPAVNSKTPAVNSRTPAVNSKTPAVYSKTPAVYSKTPAVYSKTPAVNSKTPAVNSRTPAVNSRTPAVNSKTPAVYSKTPAVNSNTPSVNSNTPSVNSNTSAVNSKTSVVSCIAPVLNSITPAVNRKTSAIPYKTPVVTSQTPTASKKPNITIISKPKLKKIIDKMSSTRLSLTNGLIEAKILFSIDSLTEAELIIFYKVLLCVQRKLFNITPIPRDQSSCTSKTDLISPFSSAYSCSASNSKLNIPGNLPLLSPIPRPQLPPLTNSSSTLKHLKTPRTKNHIATNNITPVVNTNQALKDSFTQCNFLPPRGAKRLVSVSSLIRENEEKKRQRFSLPVQMFQPKSSNSGVAKPPLSESSSSNNSNALLKQCLNATNTNNNVPVVLSLEELRRMVTKPSSMFYFNNLCKGVTETTPPPLVKISNSTNSSMLIQTIEPRSSVSSPSSSSLSTFESKFTIKE